MEKYIPYEKLSKKEKRKMDAARRNTWGELNPVTRKPQNSKAYNRNKSRNWKREMHETSSGIFLPCRLILCDLLSACAAVPCRKYSRCSLPDTALHKNLSQWRGAPAQAPHPFRYRICHTAFPA